MPLLTFLGAARTVTGSKHLMEAGNRRILVDCGLYQGGRELHEENAEPFGFDAAEIDTLPSILFSLPWMSNRPVRGPITIA